MTDPKNLRIVSLIPSATEIVALLGLTDVLVEPLVVIPYLWLS